MFLVSQIKPQPDLSEKSSTTNLKFLNGLRQTTNNVKELGNKNNENKENINQIDLKVDSKRKEIGFETESVLDISWKEVKINYNKLPMYYSKLAKKNLTGIKSVYKSNSDFSFFLLSLNLKLWLLLLL